MSLLYSFSFSMFAMLVAWAIYCKVNNPGLIDVFWGANITCIGLIHLFSRQVDTLTLLAGTLLIIWGTRLTFFLLVTRILKGKRDPRYEDISRDWKNRKVGFLAQYLFQGILSCVIALPFFTLNYGESMSLSTMGAATLIIVGIIGETLADMQLYKHVCNHQGEVCQKGLWRYSRHPNYFFECMVWLGFSVMGGSVGLGLISFLSLATLFFTMWFITIPITERASRKKRGHNYETYASKTSCFIPWPPRE